MSWIFKRYTQEQYLAGLVPSPFVDCRGQWVKPRVRVKMGREWRAPVVYINPLDHEQTK